MIARYQAFLLKTRHVENIDLCPFMQYIALKIASKRNNWKDQNTFYRLVVLFQAYVLYDFAYWLTIYSTLLEIRFQTSNYLRY